jgi:Protein of unknown function (DUF2851)
VSIHSAPEISHSFEEEAVARYWWSLPRGSILPLINGEAYQMLFAGRPGGAAGPDVRAAVLASISPRQPLLEQSMRKIIHARRYSGDVEFHVRVSDWFGHQHHSDARYNNVVLHVVLFCNTNAPTIRQDGLIVPVCSLCDLPARTITPELNDGILWPCQRVLQQVVPEARNRLLEDAGVLRFEQKVHAFIEQLHSSRSASTTNALTTYYDLSLLPALAEGLGYGRNRDFFRAVGLRLAGQGTHIPEPLGRAPVPAPLDAGRLQSLRLLVEHYRSGLWQVLYERLRRDESDYQTLRTLRALFSDVGLSLARSDILVVNVVLPFASAVALLEHDLLLNERALQLYKMHPGLSSNWITRMMTAQLQMPSEPRGSCRQQGLHYIYQETCREKCCDVCLMGRETDIL